jgi:hypothetical protein
MSEPAKTYEGSMSSKAEQEAYERYIKQKQEQEAQQQ